MRRCRRTSPARFAPPTANWAKARSPCGSSATAEDLPEASFAGQQSTFLNVVGEDNVVLAVQACWASLFEGRAIFYREEAGYDHTKVGLAVPVQRMVQSEKSRASCSRSSR